MIGIMSRRDRSILIAYNIEDEESFRKIDRDLLGIGCAEARRTGWCGTGKCRGGRHWRSG
jgi:hypothetical protein